MIGVLYPDAVAQAGQLVLAALHRSVSTTQAHAISRSAFRDIAPDVVVSVNAPDGWSADLIAYLTAKPRKLIVFGHMPIALADMLQYRCAPLPSTLEAASRSATAPSRESRESAAVVQYGEFAQTLGGQNWTRPFERFDFTDEWNNLGYGALRADGSIWAVSEAPQIPAEATLASVAIDGEAQFAYAGLWDIGPSSVLWFNRPVGPCDSFEWRLVERFLSDCRADALPCQPVLSELPWGFDAAITSRLDCDEEVESARPLWNAYREMDVPFSLAVNTHTLQHEHNHAILRELLADRQQGAVLSHTATHAPNWGGSYDCAMAEGSQSAEFLERSTGVPVRYAVSPFHQSPLYAMRGLADSGYAGCVGGIIRNDPEFVMARGGAIAGVPAGFVGHSQQCMLHGDCLRAEGDPLAVFKQAFDLAYATSTLFGYLDHPFSERYTYGWADEAARIDAHRQFVAYIRATAKRPLFLHEDAALDFLRKRSRVQVVSENGGYRIDMPADERSPFALGVEYKGAHTQVDSREGLR